MIKDDNTIIPELPKDPTSAELPTTNVFLTLCATASAERDRWAEAINEYHQCETKQVTTINEGRDFVATVKEEDEEYD